MTRREGETAIAFANRVKAEIAKAGGLVDLQWDGQLKRQRVKPELVKQQQLRFSQSVIEHHGEEEEEEEANKHDFIDSDKAPEATTAVEGGDKKQD